MIRLDPLDAWRFLESAKFTEYGKALKAWCLEMHEKYGEELKEDEGRPDQSFASDAQDEKPT